MEMLPDIWISQTGLQLHSLTTFISQDSEFVDWKRFLVLASSPLPMPSRDELFGTLSRFMDIDLEKTGSVSEQQFLQLHLWFSEDSEHEDGLAYPRFKHLKQLLFKIFCNSKKTAPMLNYEDFLLYFAMDENPIEGMLRALSIVCCQHMPSSSLFQPEAPALQKETDTSTSFPVGKNISDEPGGNALITLQDFVKVFHHGGNEFSDKQRFQGAEHTPFSQDRLSGVFLELGASETESLPFYILYQHPIIEDCLHICQRFKYHNLKNLLKCERLDASMNEGH
ncbi:Hypothetical predicted protein [Paramuricea clavata]|uniref:SPEF2 C-terminal domain-containing protein n=1 Tax=Paramuricea clavata TaxID=317549 RepID=A0A6S7JJY5_PARCT|nr:Hypothetical predicted protein [Paramuricea clavata]